MHFALQPQCSLGLCMCIYLCFCVNFCVFVCICVGVTGKCCGFSPTIVRLHIICLAVAGLSAHKHAGCIAKHTHDAR